MRTRFSLAAALLGALLVLGCGQPAAPTKATPEKKDDGDHEHGPGPHDGTIFEFGAFHGEFCMNHKEKKATVYILDGKKGTKVEPVTAEMLLLSIKSPMFQVELTPLPLATDPAGKSSRFVAVHENFGKEQEFAGTVSGKVNGTDYAEDFAEKAHDHGKK
ncbi:MAG TPA: hypothetical protein VD866_12190 [Urbifossiella sp.]|nr:hypothetical protein [Urbifossiella sp.]